MSRGKAKGSSASRSTPVKQERTRGWILIALITLGVAAGLLWVFNQKTVVHQSSQVPTFTPAIPATLIRDQKQAFAGYAGSESCRECHEEAYDGWLKSHHGLAERPIKVEIDKAAFDSGLSYATNAGLKHSYISNGLFQVSALGPHTNYESFPVDRVIGEDPLRQFLVKFPGGRFQTLEATWDPHHKEWFDVYGNENRQPGEWGHWTGRGMNWNNMCAGCHNTRLRKNYDSASDTYHTDMAEMTVGCEACHGPMKDHVVWRKAHPNTSLSDPSIQHRPGLQYLETCGSCHSRRMEFTGDFIPGEPYPDHFALTVPDESDIYYPDGQVRDEDYEYAAFLGSKMHARGVWCGDCHDPHSAKIRLPGNMLCLRCHNGSVSNAPAIDPATHSFHRIDALYTNSPAPDLLALFRRDPEKVAKMGGECVNCHMPQTFYMQRHRRHDHGFTIPDPLLTKELGIPNACNRCHQDKNVDWALEYTDKWYGPKMDRPTRKRAEAIAAARKGDPAARAPLLAILANGDTPYWQSVAAGLLGRWVAEAEVTTALVAATQNTNALVRAQAARSLGLLVGQNAPGVDTALNRLLTDPARSVRYHAAWALRATVDPQSPTGRELTQILDYLSDQPTGQMQNGAYYLARNNPAQALGHYEKAVAWDQNSAPIRHDYAVALSSLNQNTQAIAQLEAACRLAPNDAEYPFKLALAWNEAGRPDETIKALQTAVRLDPGHARAWYNLGLALNSASRTDEALAALSRGENADASNPQIPYARATILARLGRMDEARRAAARALEIQPNYPPAREFLQGPSR